MAAGLPVVVPDRGGVTTYATAANAWPAPATVRGLAGAALAAWQDPAERDRRRQRALFTAAAYQWPLVTGAFFDLYDDLVASATHSWRRSRESADADPDRRDADPRSDRSTAPAES
jgi:glycosyltransferase involved in cell wall biosynthesis